MTAEGDDGGSPDQDAGPTPGDSDATSSDAATPDAATPDTGPLDESEEVRHLRALMVGIWDGTAEAPSTATPSQWTLQIAFAADGHYEAACTAAPCAPFFDDTPGPDSRRTWTLDAVMPDGNGVGTLVVVSPPDTVEQGELARVRYADQLSFEFWVTRSGTRVGPIRYTLRRHGGG